MILHIYQFVSEVTVTCDTLMSCIISMLRDKGRMNLDELLEEVNKYIFSGKVLCLRWDVDYVNGKEMPVCLSVYTLLNYLRAEGIIRISSNNGIKIVEYNGGITNHVDTT